MKLTPQQLEQRRKGIGSSDIAAIVGLNRFRSPLDVYLSKMGQTSPSGEAAEIGHRLERPIAELVARELGYENHDLFTNVDTAHHSEHSWALATIDFMLGGAILEVKNVGQHMVADWKIGAPAYVICQVQWQLEVLNCDTAYIGALLGGSRIYTQKVERNREFGGNLLTSAEKFWTEHVVPRIPPACDGSKSWDGHLQAMHPSDKGNAIESTQEIERDAIALRSARAELDICKKRCAQYEQRIKTALGDAPEVLTSIGRITWKQPAASSKTDWKAVADEMGAPDDVVKRHTKAVIPSRRFVVPRQWK